MIHEHCIPDPRADQRSLDINEQGILTSEVEKDVFV